MHSADNAVRLSVCLSVTRRYSVKTVTRFLKLFSPLGSHTNLQSPAKEKTHCAKCIIVPVVLNFPVKFSGSVPGIVYRPQY